MAEPPSFPKKFAEKQIWPSFAFVQHPVRMDRGCPNPLCCPWLDLDLLGSSSAWQGGYPCERSEDLVQGRKLL